MINIIFVSSVYMLLTILLKLNTNIPGKFFCITRKLLVKFWTRKVKAS